MIKLKWLPNILSGSRVLFALSLIPFFFTRNPFAWLPMSLYMFAGITDAIDGPIARRVRDAKSVFGAKLDGFADMLLIAISFLLFVPMMNVFPSIFWLFLGALGFKAISMFIGLVKFRQVTTTHTIANKIFAILYFFVPVLYFFISVVAGLDAYTGLSIYLILVFALAIIVTAEEMAILLILKEENNDIKSIFHLRRTNNEDIEQTN